MSKRKYSLLSWAYGLLAGAGGGWRMEIFIITDSAQNYKLECYDEKESVF